MTTKPAAPKVASADSADDRPLPESYEAARDELTAVVEQLEAGGLTLDDSLTLWERGQALAGTCETFLAGARQRVDEALAAGDSEDLANDESLVGVDDTDAAS